MRLVAKRDGRTVKEFRFNEGPIYIGRHVHSNVFLPDRGVSRRHAAIFATHEGKWVVEDLDSANKTFLNGKEIHKAEIKTGDSLRVGSFLIEIGLEGDADVAKKRDIKEIRTQCGRRYPSDEESRHWSEEGNGQEVQWREAQEGKDRRTEVR